MKRQPPPVPRVTAEITFLRADDGGRQKPPSFTAPHQYMPHIVVQSRDVRKANVDDKGVVADVYEGIEFVERPTDYEVGTPGIFAFRLMYYPRHRYPTVLPGATFTVREGAKIVAHGVVLNRSEPIAIQSADE